MSEDDVMQLLERFAAVWAGGDADTAAALFADDAVYGEPPRFAFTGRAALRSFFADFFARHQDVAFTITRILIPPTGDAAALAWTFVHTRRADGHIARYQGMSFVDLTADGLIRAWQGVSLPLARDH